MARLGVAPLNDAALEREQAARRTRALESRCTPKSLNRDEATAVFQSSKGTGDYLTTLKSCGCSDFLSRDLPCKHIYRLAFELGVLSLDPGAGLASAAVCFDSDDLACLSLDSKKELYCL